MAAMRRLCGRRSFLSRLLIVLQGATRDNIAERLFNWNPPTYFQKWLTTMQEVKAYPMGPIWARPVRYSPAFL